LGTVPLLRSTQIHTRHASRPSPPHRARLPDIHGRRSLSSLHPSYAQIFGLPSHASITAQSFKEAVKQQPGAAKNLDLWIGVVGTRNVSIGFAILLLKQWSITKAAGIVCITSVIGGGVDAVQNLRSGNVSGAVGHVPETLLWAFAGVSALRYS